MSLQPSRTLTHLASIAGHCDVHLSVLTSKVPCINKLTEVLASGEKQKKCAQRGAAVSDKNLSWTCAQEITPQIHKQGM